ncbi:uncharacterized protein MYCFIDRAFT_211997 [Pseudocercospora fijiensis CIRAD86]|uniref:Uncharacterized protein n=1 Tax=Pseudocercospora fijiensis (strain CIRAD86) TaxID=383855 RepID=M3A6J1_PSEFD|nr:uncharacterized protein MYCFIDRAFT_211997 [Pseudocercospora fijiensis CIRAD86]EME80216.1 hypothetical protein MYCFIDRAFT_211997 [Pseudocercospora fijiensis CIRAD86]
MLQAQKIHISPSLLRSEICSEIPLLAVESDHDSVTRHEGSRCSVSPHALIIPMLVLSVLSATKRSELCVLPNPAILPKHTKISVWLLMVMTALH